MKEGMFRKGLIFSIAFLIISQSVVCASNVNPVNDSKPLNNGNWFYVGGSGPNNYSRIQDAIDNASNGDTVYVFNGTYYERLAIYSEINLIGENRDNTIIDANDL